MINQIFNQTSQNPKPIFGSPNYVIVAFPNYMALFLVLAHIAKITGIAIITSPPAKQVDL